MEFECYENGDGRREHTEIDQLREHFTLKTAREFCKDFGADYEEEAYEIVTRAEIGYLLNQLDIGTEGVNESEKDPQTI